VASSVHAQTAYVLDRDSRKAALACFLRKAASDEDMQAARISAWPPSDGRWEFLCMANTILYIELSMTGASAGLRRYLEGGV
jgi:hypothetical protein